MKPTLLFTLLCLHSMALVSCVQDECEPNCEGATCGDDGCGGSCGTCTTENECAIAMCSAGVCIDVPVDFAVLRCADDYNAEVCVDGEMWVAGCPGWCEHDGYNATTGCDANTSECVCVDVERTCVPRVSQCRDESSLWWCEVPELAATEGNFWVLYDCIEICESDGGSFESCGYWEESAQDVCLCAN